MAVVCGSRMAGCWSWRFWLPWEQDLCTTVDLNTSRAEPTTRSRRGRSAFRTRATSTSGSSVSPGAGASRSGAWRLTTTARTRGSVPAREPTSCPGCTTGRQGHGRSATHTTCTSRCSPSLDLLGSRCCCSRYPYRFTPRSRCATTRSSRSQLGAYVAFLLHAAVDWDWEMPALTIAGLLCGVAIMVVARSNPEGRPLTKRVRIGAVTAIAVVAAFAFVGLDGQPRHRREQQRRSRLQLELVREPRA